MLRVSTRTLKSWRESNQGPPYVCMVEGNKSRILYDLRDIRAWLEEMKTIPAVDRRGFLLIKAKENIKPEVWTGHQSR